MSLEISVFARIDSGTAASKRLRKQGFIPAILFGDKGSNENLSLKDNELRKLLKNPGIASSVIALNLEGKKTPVLLRHVQMHPCRIEVLHVDFERINKDKTISLHVPLHFINAENCPGVKLSSGIVNYITNTLEISCLPGHIPAEIIVDLINLNAGGVLHVSDLILPKGVTAYSLARGENPSVVTIVSSSQSETDQETTTSEAPPSN